MKIDPTQVEQIAELAKLHLTAEEVARFSQELSSILDHFAALQGLDTEEVTPTAYAVPLANVTRPDEVGPSLSRSELLAMAPRQEDGFIVVPPILG